VYGSAIVLSYNCGRRIAECGIKSRSIGRGLVVIPQSAIRIPQL